MLSSTIQREQINGVEVIALRGQFIGGKETDDLRSVLMDVVRGGSRAVILDMSNVTYLNSTALGVLIAAHSSITKNNGKIVLCGLSQSLENIFIITKLSMVFDIYADRQQALDSLVSSSTIS
ncbi:MAG: STAS domain-containing protein [Bacteroidota bacterium]|nr:STAS domain-containing protein [Candidatus Kapabacteria bacterium]MCS7302015.1 STAS domain-containing protein [Candidatus Kapabacteria bacterium]MCX7936815.1 STAS domain-containing protein [Chlorobiota bacterium]MDW8074534.1 STAS domain-containing protein [Bacteroidota bacterium]MDW8270990.1 STAS domain-containing protein [Bacteroidota bacterium]